MRIRRIHVIAALVLVAPVAGYAQEKGNVGMTMGYPAAVGALWHVSDDVALRPEISISRSSIDTSSGVGDSSSWSLGLGISALFYVTRADNLRTYVSPRYSYSRSSATATAAATPVTSELTTSTSTVSVSFGAQYALSPRFSAFGEVGFGYGRGGLRSSLAGTRTTSQNWSTRTGAGVILYF
jgi:outer membrane protein with beta-barrel domain